MGLFLLGSFALVTLVLAGVMTLGCAARPSPHETAEVTGEDVTPVLLSGLPGCELLTERERVVLEESLSGLTGREIATKCGISESTVATYRKRGYGKLRVSGMGDLKRLLASWGDEGATLAEGGESMTSMPCDNAYGSSTLEEFAGKESSGDLSRGQRLVALLVLVLFVVFVPPSSIHMDVSRVAPFVLGLILAVTGMVLRSRVGREGRPCIWSANGRVARDARVRLIVLGMSALSEGAMIGYAWLTPLPWPLVPEVALDFFAPRLWSAFGLVVLLIGAGEFCSSRVVTSGAVEKARAFARHGISVVLTRVPQCLVLTGVGLLLVNLEIKLSSNILFDTLYAVHQIWSWVPRLLALLLLTLVLMGETGFGTHAGTALQREDFDRKLLESGLSPLQVRVVMMSLDGLSCSEIATKLNLASGTVRSYRSRACKLLGVGSIDELRKLT